jgi:hypothetical protein
MKVYAPIDFVANLANDELRETEAPEAVGVKDAEGLEVVGVVKCIADSSTLIGFSRLVQLSTIWTGFRYQSSWWNL